MKRTRMVGLALILVGAAALGFLLFQTMDRQMNAASIRVFGMPGTLICGMIALIAIAVGGGLAARRPSASPPP